MLKFAALFLAVFLFHPPFSKAQVPHLKFEMLIELPGALEYVLTASKLPKNFKNEFNFNSGLQLQVLSPGDQLVLLEGQKFKYRIIENGDGNLSLKVQGQLLHPELTNDRALILMSSLNWNPLALPLQTYELSVTVAKQLKVYSPASDLASCGESCFYFAERTPQEDIYLVLGQYHEFSKVTPQGKKVGVLLFENDRALADSYLQLLPEYLERYESLLGAYQYSGFYVVENFNETGFGMPGFTLLGSSVIRLPFILKSSLPHEVLHNWWGNGVYVDYERGNWCEGLTTYLADHLEQEKVGTDSDYRRDTLVSYADFVTAGGADSLDFPLIEFQGRHSEASQAVGYGKSMMFFHMLKKWVGDIQFQQILRDFYAQHLFQRVGFADLLKSAAQTVKLDLEKQLGSWLYQTGAATISPQYLCETGSALLKITSTPREFNYILPYQIESPHGVTKGQVQLVSGQAIISLPRQGGTIDLDPNFDVFRTLSPGEKPVSFSRILGAQELLVWVQPGLESQFKLFHQGFTSAYEGKIKMISQAELVALPKDSRVLIFANHSASVLWLNQFLPKSQVQVSVDGVNYQGQTYAKDKFGWLLMAEDLTQQQVFVWLSPSSSHDNSVWGRQLTHYSKFSWLLFEGRKNLVKRSFAAGKKELKVDFSACP